MEASTLDLGINITKTLDYILYMVEKLFGVCYEDVYNSQSEATRVIMKTTTKKTHLTSLEKDYIRSSLPLEVNYPFMTIRGLPSYHSPMKIKNLYDDIAWSISAYVICCHYNLEPISYLTNVNMYDTFSNPISFEMCLCKENYIASLCYQVLISRAMREYGHRMIGEKGESFRELVKLYLLHVSQNLKTLQSQRDLYYKYLEAVYFDSTDRDHEHFPFFLNVTEWIYTSTDGKLVRDKFDQKKINWREISTVDDLPYKDISFETLKQAVIKYVSV